jgi:hypothetical protein
MTIVHIMGKVGIPAYKNSSPSEAEKMEISGVMNPSEINVAQSISARMMIHLVLVLHNSA